MSSMEPLMVAGGLGLVTALGVGAIVKDVSTDAAIEHPDGSQADAGARDAKNVGMGFGLLAGLGGVAAILNGSQTLGIALLGTGIGAALGAGFAHRSFQKEHGIGVETKLQDVLSKYDDGNDRRIDLDADGFWRGRETNRTVDRSSTDSNGSTYYDVDEYSIERLATRADGNYDRIATSDELRAVIASYDLDANGRLQPTELVRFDAEAGEVQLR